MKVQRQCECYAIKGLVFLTAPIIAARKESQP